MKCAYVSQLNKAIAHHLDTDKDIVSFRLVCRGTNDAIDADHGSFWRHRFRENYAFKEGPANKELRRVYQRRSKMLRRGTGYNFFRGYRKREQDVIDVLRDLIVGKYYLINDLSHTVLRLSRSHTRVDTD